VRKASDILGQKINLKLAVKKINQESKASKKIQNIPLNLNHEIDIKKFIDETSVKRYAEPKWIKEMEEGSKFYAYRCVAPSSNFSDQRVFDRYFTKNKNRLRNTLVFDHTPPQEMKNGDFDALGQ